MENVKPTYDELKNRLDTAERLITALKNGGRHAAAIHDEGANNPAFPTERELIQAYIESEENFRNSMEACPLGIRVITADGTLFYANKAVLGMFGYKTVEELQAVPKEQLYTPESYAGHIERKAKRIKCEFAPSEYEINIRRPDGQVRTMLVSRREITWGGKQQFIAMYQDITDIRKVEASLRLNTKLVQSISDTIISSDENYKINSWNKAAEEMYGWSADEVMGKTVMEYTSPAYLNTTHQEILSQLRADGYWKGEAIHHRRNGDEIYVLMTISLLKDEKGNEQGAVTVFKDITDRKKAEAALAESRQRFYGAFHYSPGMNLIINRNSGSIVDVNDAFCHVTGYSQDELKGRLWDDLNPWYDEAQKKMVTNELNKKGVVSNTELDFRMKNGEIRSFNTNLTMLKLENQPYIFASGIDVTTRKNAEESLIASEKRYRDLLDNMMESCQIIDRDWRYAYINDASARIGHFNKEELLGRKLSDTLPGVEKTEVFAAYKKCMEQRIPVHIESEAVMPDGNHIWVGLNIQPIPEGIFILALDITERRKAEMEIHRSEERFRRVFQSGPLGIVLSGMDLRFTMANARFCELYGYPEVELRGMMFKDFSFPEDFNEDVSVLEKLKNGQMAYFNIEKKNKKKNGEVIWCDITVTVIRDNAGDPQGFLSMVQDITTRKEADEKITHLNLALRSIRNINQLITREKDRDRLIKGVCDNLVVGRSFHSAWIILFDDNRQPVTWAGTNLERNLTGLVEAFKKGDLPACVQKAFTQNSVIVTEDPQQHCPDCPILGKTAGIGSMTVRLETDGTLYGVICGSMQSSIMIDDDEISLFSEVAADITFALRDIDLGSSHELLLQEQFRTAKLESIGTLAGGIAHDFNNLLAGIMGNIGLAKSYLAPDSGAIEVLDEAEKAALRSRELTQQLLTFARGGKPIKKLVNIAAVIKDSATFALRGSKTKLELSLPRALWLVEADEGQMGQVIHNLVINADEAMCNGGTLRVAAKNLTINKPGTLPLSNGNYVQIDVSDTGVGISAENLQKIFEPYFTTKQKGSGLGLTSAYSVIKSHGGYLAAESVLNHGSVFHIYLLASRKTVKGEKKVAAKKSAQAGGKVLVMDDDEIIRKMLKNMLNLAGYEAEVTSDGAEALEKYQTAMNARTPFFAVIMDLTIPGGMGGKEAVTRLLEIDPEAAVIVSSGYATDPIMSEYKKHGFSAVIAKPYSIKQLQETLTDLTAVKKK